MPLPPTPPSSNPPSPVFTSRSPTPIAHQPTSTGPNATKGPEQAEETKREEDDGLNFTSGSTDLPKSAHAHPRDISQVQAPKPASVETVATHALPHAESSNLPALRRQHVTTGYRAGVAAGRDDPDLAQRGFDEGYPVGAALGMRMGFLMGLKSVQDALSSSGATAKTEVSEKKDVGKKEVDLGDLVQEMEVKGLVEKEVRIEDLEGENVEVKEKVGDWGLPEGWMGQLQSLKSEEEQARQLCQEWEVKWVGDSKTKEAIPR